MDGSDERLSTRLGRWSPALFLLGGVLLVGYAALNGIAAYTDLAFAKAEDVIGPAGFLLGFVGALGLYPSLVDRTAPSARVGAVCTLIGIAGSAAITVHGLAVLAGMTAGNGPIVLLLFVAVGMVPGYVSLGVASLRDTAEARSVGFFLFLPAVVFAAMLSQPLVYSQLGLFSEATMTWSNFAISSSQAIAHLAIGYTLYHRLPQLSRVSPHPDGTVG